jgi:hypothetical protein
MYLKTGNRVCSSIDESLLELKDRPYANILDLVDTYRASKDVPDFMDWHEFFHHTWDGRKIDVEVAKETDFFGTAATGLL